jgi:RNA polymerase sigma factor (sigma-70 family)
VEDEHRAEVYRKYADELTRFATGLVGPADAPDVVSAAMLACLWSPAWAQVRDPRPYLFRAVLNQARSAARSTRRRRGREQRSAELSSTSPVTARNLPTEAEPEVLRAVAALSVRQRAVIFLTYWADLAPADIGDLLGISDGSVRRHLARGRRTLREVLHD